MDENDSLLNASPDGMELGGGDAPPPKGKVASATLSALRNGDVTRAKSWVLYGAGGLVATVAVVAYIGVTTTGTHKPLTRGFPKDKAVSAAAPLVKIPSEPSSVGGAPVTASTKSRAKSRAKSSTVVPSVTAVTSSDSLTAKMLKVKDAQILARYTAIEDALTQRQQARITEQGLAVTSHPNGPAFSPPKAQAAQPPANPATAPLQVSVPQPPMSGYGGAQPQSGSPQQADVAYLKESQRHATDRDDYLNQRVQNPLSRYELQAGSVIPATMITGINSQLPGEITAQVRQDVYSSINGAEVIPAGSRLVGAYNNSVAYGQDRVQVVWERLIFPNGQSINLDGMAGADRGGYSGFKDIDDTHFWSIFGHALLYSVIGAVGNIAGQGFGGSSLQNPTIGQTAASGIGQQLAQTGQDMVQQGMQQQPTLKIRPGYKFNVMVRKDMVFPGAYNPNG
ncbi:TrbI/VirB10 family protein [Acidithiobacillus sp.]|uniref:TrbI/VirB10 family protein n=1 Tax=Acidithiobacillus sp. TaxID=1872118 RepID=UPI003D043789